MGNFYSVKKSSPYSIKATKKASAYTSNKKQNNVYSNSIGIFDKEYLVIQSTVPGSTSSTPVVIPVVPVANVATIPSVAPSTVPEEPVGKEGTFDWRSLIDGIFSTAAPSTVAPMAEKEAPKQMEEEPKQNSSKKKTGIIIALAVLAAAAFLFYPGKKK